MPNPLLARFSFVHRDVFPADDRMARYVERLSVALGDLRIAGHYATRSRQNSAQRLYFVRLTASHLREIVLLLDPPDRTVIPNVEEFLASLPRGTQPSRADIRKSHRRALRLLDKPMAKGRADVVGSNGRPRRPTLRDDLRDLRNGFFHYGHTKAGDDALAAAMDAVSGNRTSYVVRERTMRAEYADLLGTKLAHPFELRFAADLHRRVHRSCCDLYPASRGRLAIQPPGSHHAPPPRARSGTAERGCPLAPLSRPKIRCSERCSARNYGTEGFRSNPDGRAEEADVRGLVVRRGPHLWPEASRTRGSRCSTSARTRWTGCRLGLGPTRKGIERTLADLGGEAGAIVEKPVTGRLLLARPWVLVVKHEVIRGTLRERVILRIPAARLLDDFTRALGEAAAP
jgi:hypothetical protein